MSMTDETEARHQQVREFVERLYPDCRVTEIYEHSTTQYKRQLHGAEYVLARLDAEFMVEAQSQIVGKPSVRCQVVLLHDGSLRIGDVWWITKM